MRRYLLCKLQRLLMSCDQQGQSMFEPVSLALLTPLIGLPVVGLVTFTLMRIWA